MVKGALGSQQQKGSEIMNECRKFETSEETEMMERKGILKLVRSNSERHGKWKLRTKEEDKWEEMRPSIKMLGNRNHLYLKLVNF